MPLAPFKPSISNQVRAEIDTELDRIEKENAVKIIFAVESGSRAWGFPSPDSDYDVRFVYARKLDWYLSIMSGRDVIERPISDELDISGWDIKKALGLLIKPNPVMFEWLSSPIRYRWNDKLCGQLIDFSQKPSRTTAVLYHYLNLGRGQFDLHLEKADKIRLKKYFYILRPALAIRWMRMRPDEIPPMNVQVLIAGLDIEPDIIAIIDELISRKAKMNEKEAIKRIASLEEFIQKEFDWAEKTDKKKAGNNLKNEADELFREIVKTLDKV